MSTSSTPFQREAIAPLTHIFLSLDLLESRMTTEEYRSYLTIIRRNAERLQVLIKNSNSATALTAMD
jgi:signal transduction histidine kinase